MWYLFSVWLHLLAATVWIGSMAFLGLVLVPVLREEAFHAARTRLLYRTGLRFRWVGWAALGVLVATGIANVHFRGYEWMAWWNGAVFEGVWGHLLATKLVLVLVVLAVGAWHDFHLGPRAARALEIDPEAPSARHVRRMASWVGRITLLLSVIILALAVMLVRGMP